MSMAFIVILDHVKDAIAKNTVDEITLRHLVVQGF